MYAATSCHESKCFKLIDLSKNPKGSKFPHYYWSTCTYMHGGGPSPSGSSFLHSYGLAAVSRAHTSAKGRFPETLMQSYYQYRLAGTICISYNLDMTAA